MRSPEYDIDLPHIYSGKVRDIFEADDGLWLLVASDRISAFDVVMVEPVPHKGRVLTAMSAFWFEQLGDVVGNHLVSTDLADMPEAARIPELDGRTMLCRRADMLPIECIVRGYITGSAWKEYQAEGTMHGQRLPAGLREAERLPEPVFTPSTKADSGHDENIGFDEAVELVGAELADQAREVSLALYSKGAALAADRGIIIADTKFELGLIDGELEVADEILTPDSSRFWPAQSWSPGATPPSFDKQPVRDWLDQLDWDKTPPPPALPAEVIDASADRYRRAYEMISGRALDSWPGVAE